MIRLREEDLDVVKHTHGILCFGGRFLDSSSDIAHRTQGKGPAN